MGVIGAGGSSYELYRIARLIGERKTEPPAVEPPLSNGTTRRLALEIRTLAHRGLQSLRLDAMRGKFRRIMGLLFLWHLVQFMTIPIVTPFVVNDLAVSDQLIAFAGGAFNLTMFFGSLALSRMTKRFGNKTLTGGGIFGLAMFPLFTALGVAGYLMGNLLGGLGYALFGGALYNYILENMPADDRPAHMAWYSLVSNAAILLGSLTGPLIAGQIGYVPALLIFGIGRFLAGVAILRWG
jgi:MFS family permease